MKHNNAFSLLELSIVLVIIGLIAGGIVAGSSMIRAAELRAVVTEYTQYQTAVNTFRDKYLGLPGDLKNAGAFWGYPGGAESNCPATAGTGTETCNGDDDRKIENPSTTSIYNERYMFWQHLANADLIAGSFDGRSTSVAVEEHVLGVNAPASKLSGGGWTIYDLQTQSGSVSLFDGAYNNSFWFGGVIAGSAPNIDMLTASEAWNLDSKIDDGKPALGRIVARDRKLCALAADGSALTTAAADAAKLDATYNLAEESFTCVLLMRNMF